MAKPRLTFNTIKQRDCAYILEFLKSKKRGAATMQEIRYACRRRNMAGMAETVVDWLEQAGVAKYEPTVDAVYLNTPPRGPGKRSAEEIEAEAAALGRTAQEEEEIAAGATAETAEEGGPR